MTTFPETVNRSGRTSAATHFNAEDLMPAHADSPAVGAVGAILAASVTATGAVLAAGIIATGAIVAAVISSGDDEEPPDEPIIAPGTRIAVGGNSPSEHRLRGDLPPQPSTHRTPTAMRRLRSSPPRVSRRCGAGRRVPGQKPEMTVPSGGSQRVVRQQNDLLIIRDLRVPVEYRAPGAGSSTVIELVMSTQGRGARL